MKILILILILTSTGYSQSFFSISKKDFTKSPYIIQTPNPNTPTIPNVPWCDKNCKASISAYISGAGLDVYSSLGHREANPLWRDSEGQFNATSNSLYKAGILALTLWKQKSQPERMNYIRYLGAIMFGTVGGINFARSKQSTPIF